MTGAAAGTPGAPGFVFWGLFVACGVVLAGYFAWMWWTERRR